MSKVGFLKFTITIGVILSSYSRKYVKKLSPFKLRVLNAVYENFGEPDFPWFDAYQFALCVPGERLGNRPKTSLNALHRFRFLYRDQNPNRTGDLDEFIYQVSDLTRREMLRRKIPGISWHEVYERIPRRKDKWW